MLQGKRAVGSEWPWLVLPHTYIVADIFTVPVGGFHLPPLLLRSLPLRESQHSLVLQHMLGHREQVKGEEGGEEGGGREEGGGGGGGGGGGMVIAGIGDMCTEDYAPFKFIGNSK